MGVSGDPLCTGVVGNGDRTALPSWYRVGPGFDFSNGRDP